MEWIQRPCARSQNGALYKHVPDAGATILDIFLVEGSWFRRGNNGPGKKDNMPGHEDLRTSSDWQNQLYSRYHHKVFGICLYFLKDREEARDASHDVFIKAFKAWKDFEWKCDPLDRRAQLAVEEETLQNCEPDEDLVLHRMRLEKIMPDVRGKLREILRLSLEQGLNHREIAIQMGVSRVAITRRLTRFKKELQDVGHARESAFTRAQSRQMIPVQPRPQTRIRAQVFSSDLSGTGLPGQNPGHMEMGVEAEFQLIAA
jgi:RNA polymerase sigma-70 factor, ECF subfamily